MIEASRLLTACGCVIVFLFTACNRNNGSEQGIVADAATNRAAKKRTAEAVPDPDWKDAANKVRSMAGARNQRDDKILDQMKHISKLGHEVIGTSDVNVAWVQLLNHLQQQVREQKSERPLELVHVESIYVTDAGKWFDSLPDAPRLDARNGTQLDAGVSGMVVDLSFKVSKDQAGIPDEIRQYCDQLSRSVSDEEQAERLGRITHIVALEPSNKSPHARVEFFWRPPARGR